MSMSDSSQEAMWHDFLTCPDNSDEEKGFQIKIHVLDLATHNSISKGALVEMVKYLMGLCFEEEEDAR